MDRELAVVLLSGGMDSLVTCAMAAENYELALLHINYGQRTEIKEQECFDKIAQRFKAKHKLTVKSDHFRNIGGSSLTDDSMKVSKTNINSKEIPTSYVPFRNANFLSIAVSWAEVLKASKIFIGAVEEDSSGYPDCRKIFFDDFNKVINTGTKPDTKIKIETPIINMNKAEIVETGMKLKVPFEYSWSCYKNNDEACGECDSCALRLMAFSNAGYSDPIKYALPTEIKNK